jgi:GH24 family phage-related lysozyme (muramidase)
MSRKPKQKQTDDWNKYPFLTQKGIDIIKKYSLPRIYIGMGRYSSYKNYGEDIWRIGYDSKKIGKHWVGAFDKASKEQIDAQLVTDLKEFSSYAAQYVFVPLNTSKKAALLSFAHSVGLSSFKECRLLQLINACSSKNLIIKEWSPFINTIWRSGGELMISRRRTELNTFLAPDAEIPTFVPHKCELKQCLLNLPETWNGAPTQVKAIEYLERKLLAFDPSGDVLRRFFRYWNEKPGGLGSYRP